MIELFAATDTVGVNPMENIAAAKDESATALAMHTIENKQVRLSQRGVFMANRAWSELQDWQSKGERVKTNVSFWPALKRVRRLDRIGRVGV